LAARPCTAAAVGSAETTAGCAPARHADAAAASSRRPGAANPTGTVPRALPQAAPGPLAAARATATAPGPLAAARATATAPGPLAAARATATAPGPLAAARATAAASATAAATSAGTWVSLAAGPPQTNWADRGADRCDAEAASATPRTPAPRGRPHHCTAPAGITGYTGSRSPAATTTGSLVTPTAAARAAPGPLAAAGATSAGTSAGTRVGLASGPP
jgi:hypothetical protein